MLQAKYRWQKTTTDNQALVEQIATQCQLPPVLAKLLVARGCKDLKQAQLFLKPQLAQIKQPHYLHDMDKAVARLKQAVADGEQITIYGDYDADGMTSTTVMYEALESLGAQVDYFIPNRFKDGYGPNQDEYKRLIDNGTQLIVTVDNGVTGKDEVAYAKSRGVDVVITDHHKMPEDLPDAVAIVHPQYPGAEYSYADLSGVGVAFKVAWALLEEFPTEMLDLVAIGEIADVVSLANENHALVYFGLQQLRAGMRPGIHALAKLANIDEAHLTDQDIGFQIAPRLNALGRIADANDGVKLLTTLDEDQAAQLARQVDECNNQRQELVKKIYEEALAKAQAPDNLRKQTLLIVGHGWHQGVLGIVASRLVEATGKPTIVASVDPGQLVAKGSGRSVEGFDIFAALTDHRDLMTAFGGHAMACGLSFNIVKLPQLAKALEEGAQIQGVDLTKKPNVNYAGTLTTDQLTKELYQQIQRLAPFGPDNEEPQFCVHHPVIEQAQLIGKDKQHLKLRLQSKNGGIDVLAFKQAELLSALATTPVNMLVKLNLNRWHGQENAQLMLGDCHFEGPALVDNRKQPVTARSFEKQMSYLIFDPKLRENVQGHANGPVLSPAQVTGTPLHNHALAIVDMPQSLQELTTVLGQLQDVTEIHLDFRQFKVRPVFQIPDRQQFVNFYQLLRKIRTINLNQQAKQVINSLKIDQNQLIFMIRVFLELRFVTMKNGFLKISDHVEAGDLKHTHQYRQAEEWQKVVTVLAKSSSAQLGDWIRKHLTN
ncbi:MAG TPA: single-stranded-DNA-specific exonuclease RecJ [Candidatus Limosilactobacillus merdigallinarum]|uniref:Single-stranded-DNA-specific exonuclease RecJ n=1 Tax=Candidatus Limosilactobacillus merdigallinarum TaxID=2838652 RepID=A0A9D2AK01_9LACO|nr:single-stranded-DNA-specific exonuclease RecJ [Candidatus Limosilactobacillus merdigallinarum]